LALILGIDRFMSEARAITNIIGNGVATLVVSRWEGELDMAKLQAELQAGPGGLIETPELQPQGAGRFAGPGQVVLGDAD
jgi:aerobic C4-dicarboxylate transport protein